MRYWEKLMKDNAEEKTMNFKAQYLTAFKSSDGHRLA